MSSTTDALANAAGAENAAIFTYGVITAFVSASRRPMVDDNIAAHRTARDAVNEAITKAGGTPPEPAAGYTLPLTVNDPVGAAKAAEAAEDDCAVAYRSVIEKADSESARILGVDQLTASARRAAQWRIALGDKPATVPFPGRR
ncbi:ferritin-like domain-containing protein [Gordonia sp. DT30]|uniref:ferritin-like domain-containing protein n=1 Tax=unclassified Gordonia (in: high G+C Gram-positive bacteria) TaxID=2657482 RepID=UPI003CEEE3EB